MNRAVESLMQLNHERVPRTIPMPIVVTMPLFVVSDLHLTEGREARLFDDDRQGAAFARLADRIARVAGAEVVLLGDIFDLTAMTAPERGLERFARTLRFDPD